MEETVFIALGSNLGDRAASLSAAVARLREAITVSALSPVYETAPMYVSDQPAFLNMVLQGTTQRAPLDLLDLLKRLETEIGRVPSFVNGPRAIDLDLLYLGQQQVDHQRLTLPHPRIGERAFVLAPFADIAPDWVGPGEVETIAQRLASVPERDTVQRSNILL